MDVHIGHIQLVHVRIGVHVCAMPEENFGEAVLSPSASLRQPGAAARAFIC